MALENKERAKELLEKSSSETVKYYEDGKRQIHLQIDKKDGESVAFLEVPKYIPEEIEKALDINVDELVRNRKDLPEVVLKNLYDDKLEELRIANQTIQDLEIQVADLESLLAQRTAERDNEIERRISAELALAELENLYIALSDQFAQTVFELQKAIERSTQEAIERVSLEARFEAIKAQLNASLLAIEVREEQVSEEQSANLRELVDDNGAGTFDTHENIVGWYIDNVKSVDFLTTKGVFSFHDRRTGNQGWVTGGNLYWINVSENPITVKIDYTYSGSGDIASGPNPSKFPFQLKQGNSRVDPKNKTFTIPAATGEVGSLQPGELTLVFTGGGDHTSGGSGISNKNSTKTGTMKFIMSDLGKTFEFDYWNRQERRSNEFGAGTEQ